MKLFKKITGVTFVMFGVLGVIMLMSYELNLDWFRAESTFFSRGNDGGASNAPIMFGIISLSGVFILGQAQENKNIQE
jgi:hypothetical protein